MLDEIWTKLRNMDSAEFRELDKVHIVDMSNDAAINAIMRSLCVRIDHR
jgi:hypothetical protein